MANDKSKKKKVTQDASSPSSSRRSSRETLSRKQTKESPIKEVQSSTPTRKSERLGNKKPSGTVPISGKNQEQIVTTPMKMYDRRKKSVEETTSPKLKSKNVKSLKQCLMETIEDKKHENQSLGRKRKRAVTSVMASSKHHQLKTESGESDLESEENSSSSSRDVDAEVEKPDESSHSLLDNSKTAYSGSKSLGHKGDSDDECNQEESTPKGSKSQSQCETSDIKELLNEITCDTDLCETSSFKDRTASDGLVSGVMKSIWDSREVIIADFKGLLAYKQKQYFVKYNSLAHIHNQWVPEMQLLREAPQLVRNYIKNGSMQCYEECTVPHQLLKKRLLLSLNPGQQNTVNTVKVLSYNYEWLVQWEGLDYEQATWESEDKFILNSPKAQELVKEYEKNLGDKKISALSDDKIEEIQLKLPTVSTGMDNIHLSYVKNLHDAWNKGQNIIVFDEQERTMRIALFILSLKNINLPYLLISTPDSLSQWEDNFIKLASCNSYKVSLENTQTYKLLQVENQNGTLAFQLLLYPVDAFVKDLNMLKPIKWEAVIVDESQSSEISTHFNRIKSLSTNKRLLVFCGPLGMSMTSYLDVLSLLDCDIVSEPDLNDFSKLKESFSKCIAYECKSNSSKFLEFWVPVQISNVQLEQYCSMLLSNSMALSSCSKTDTVGSLHDILVSNRKCCDHPYIVDQNLQGVLTKDIELSKILDVGIKASGKLQFLDKILPEFKKRQLRVLILFQPLSGTGKDSTSIGDILDDFIRQRFGENSYERVDGIGMIPSKKQAALTNFNNTDKGRFVFLLEYRACLPSIKLSSIDTVIIFDSEWNPANDLRALQKIAIDSKSEQIMIFRLYTCSTLEEKILRLAEHNVTIDSKLLNLTRGIIDDLLMWDANYLFNKLDEFHNYNESEERWLTELVDDLLNLISHKCKNKDEPKLMVTKVQPICGPYGKNIPLPNKTDEEPPHSFWKKLLTGKDPCWKYLSRSNSRQRKRPQYFEESPKKSKLVNDDVARKRKKIENNIVEPVITNPVIEVEGEAAGDSRVPSTDDSQSPLNDDIDNKLSFHDQLKVEISKLCEVLGLSEDVKKMVERFLEYVIENYRVNKEPLSTLNAFLVSLCWIGCALLDQKVDRSQSVVVANEQLNYSCKEEEANSIYLKLEPAKHLFLQQTDNQKSLDPVVNEEILESSLNQHDNVAAGGLNDSPCAGAPEETVPSVEPLVSDPTGPTDNEVEANPNHSPTDNLRSQSQVLEGSAPGSNGQSQTSGKRCDPLGAEMEKLLELKDAVTKCHESIKVKLKCEYEKELGEIIGQLNHKYESKHKDAEAACQLKYKEIDICFSRVVKNKILADTYRSKCQDLTPFNPNEIQAMQNQLPQFNRPPARHPLQIVHQAANLFSTRPPSTAIPTTRPPPSAASTPTRPPLPYVIPNITPTRPPPPTATPATTPSRPSPPTTTPTTTPTRPPPSAASTPTRPPLPYAIPNITPTRPPPPTATPATTPSRPPPPTATPTTRPPPSAASTPTRPSLPYAIPNITPSGPPPPTASTPSRPPPTTTPTPTSTPSRPPSPTTSTPPSTTNPYNRFIRPPPPNITRNPRLTTEIRAPAPHIQPFKPSTMKSPNMSSQHTPTTLPPPHLSTNHPWVSRPSSQPPVPFQLPPLPATSSSHPQTPLPPMPSVSITHTGLYTRPNPDIYSQRAVDLLMDVDKQARSHTSPSPPEVLDLTNVGKERGDLVCLSDDD